MTDLSEARLVRTDGERADAAEWLAEHSWRVEAVPSSVEMTRLGRPATDDLVDEAMDSVLLRARLDGEPR